MFESIYTEFIFFKDIIHCYWHIAYSLSYLEILILLHSLCAFCFNSVNSLLIVIIIISFQWKQLKLNNFSGYWNFHEITYSKSAILKENLCLAAFAATRSWGLTILIKIVSEWQCESIFWLSEELCWTADCIPLDFPRD